MSGITFLKQSPSKLGWDSPIRKMVCGLSFLLWLALLQTSLAVNVPGPNGTVVTQILSATSSNPEVKVVEDRDLGKILVYPPQPKEFTVEIIARIMYPDDQYLEKISTVMVGGAGVTIESSEIRNSLILATLKVAPGASGGRFSITYENEDNSNHKGCNVRLLPVEIKAHQDKNGPQGSAPKYKDAPSVGSATNLFSVWPNEEIILKVKMPAPFDQQGNLPANLIKWDVPGHTFADNTLEARMKWGLNFFNAAVNTKEITITIGGAEFKVHVKVQGVGILTEAEGAALVPHAAPVMLAHSFEAKNYTNATFPLGPKRDAMRHAYWCSLSVSTFPVTGGDVPFISTGHEHDNRYKDKQQAFNSTMDLKNNAVGISVNRQVNGLPDKPAIKQALEQKYTAGEMYIWEVPPGAASASQGNSEGILIKSNGKRIH